MKLANKTILITGAAIRLGKVISLAAAREGANIIIHYNQSDVPANALKDQITNLGRQAHIIQADLSSQKQSQEFADNVFLQYEIDAVINNASIFSDHNWATTTPTDWQVTQAINLTAPFLICQAFAKSLPPRKEGRIINLLDWRALRPGSDHLPYTISKAGLAALTKSLAISLAPSITVNGVALGAILPPSDGGEIEDLVSNLPIPRWAELEEVESTILFLLCGPAYITGEIIHLDGGRHLI